MTDSASFVLASSSPRRRELAARLGLSFTVVEPRGVDEEGCRGSGFRVCRELARRKAEEVLSRLDGMPPGTPVLGCDTVVALVRGGWEEILSKPADGADARRMLRNLSGATHRVLTGVAVAARGAATRVEEEVTHVRFRPLSDEEIEAYVESGEPLDKAGAYGIQAGGRGLVESIRGCYYNVVGLPILLAARMLGVEGAHLCDCGGHPLQRGAPGCRLAAQR